MANSLLKVLGYYSIKKTIKQKLFYKRLQVEDARKKRQTLRLIKNLPDNTIKQNKNTGNVVVSLTSYGLRITDTLPYTLYSLLIQTQLPDRILVWLEEELYNKDNLPEILKQFESKGVEFLFVKNIKSYKKLIPTLCLCPDSIIITVDDDWYYNENTVKWLVSDYLESDKRTVFGTWGFLPLVKDGKYLPYNQWNDKDCDVDKEVSLIGCGGILYPPNIFDDEILKVDLFMKFAPAADDLWFWVMEKRAGVKVRLSTTHGYGLHQAVNRIDVWKPKESNSLYKVNVLNGKNDEQFLKLISYYGISPQE